MEWQKILAVAIGGAIGSSGRYIVVSLISNTEGQHRFALGIFAVNLIGSFLIGLFSYVALSMKANLSALSVGLSVGLLGGFTTYATFSHDIFSMLDKGHYRTAIGYVVLTLSLCLGGVFAGYGVGKLLYPASMQSTVEKDSP